MNEERIAMYTDNNDDSIIVNTTDESISIWDQVESMMASEMTVGEVDALVHEIEHLRALITEWVDADSSWRESDVSQDRDYFSGRTLTALTEAQDALRKAVGR